MTAALTLTDAGRAAIADGGNVGLAAVTFTRLALGSGTGSGDQSMRAALETQQDIVAVTGAADTPMRIAIRGDFMPTEAYAATEVGLFARVGAGGDEFLAAYWIAERAADAVAAASPGTALVIAGIVEVVSSAAEINIAPALNISVGVPPDVVRESRHATVDQRGIIQLATLLLARGGLDNERAITSLVLQTILGGYGTREWVNGRIAGIDLSGYALRSELAGRGVAGPRLGRVASYHATAADNGRIIEVDATAGARTVNLPDLGLGDNGYTLGVMKTDSSANSVTADPHGADTVNGAATYALRTQWEAVILKWTGARWLAIGMASPLVPVELFVNLRLSGDGFGDFID